MNKTELVSNISHVLRDKGVRKRIRAPRHVFHISDDEGNSKDFIVKETNKTAVFNAEDITEVLDAMIEVVKDALMRGEKVSIHGVGSLGVRYTKFGPKKIVGPGDEGVPIPPRYVPKFTYGKDLKRCARIYTEMVEDRKMSPVIDDDGDDEEDGDT